MVKLLLFLLSMITFSFLAPAAIPNKKLMYCSYQEARRLQPIYKKREELTDKTKHCTISCKIAYKCSSLGSWHIGLFKELADLFGSGNPEVADLKANVYGIRLSKFISNKQQCEDYCLLEFQP